MKSLNEFIKESYMINERFVNAFEKEDMYKYADEVWTLLEKAYEYCGGMAGMDNVDQLIDETDIWKMVRKDNRIVAVMTYSTKRSGRKICYCGCEKSEVGKAAIVKLMQEDFIRQERESWAEVSGAMEVTALRNGAMPIPAYIASLIMNDKKFEKILPDGYHYTRKIGGQPHTKLMIGNFKHGIKYSIEDNFIDELIETAKKIGKEEASK